LNLHPFWFAIAFGAFMGGIMQLARVIGRRSLPQIPAERTKATFAERAGYWSWALCFFPLSMVLAIGLSTDSSRTPHEAAGVMYALMAAAWLALGLIPYLWVARGGPGELAEFRRKVEYHSRSRFGTLVILWWIAIALMALVAAKDLLVAKVP
jgi:hypothetical protein